MNKGGNITQVKVQYRCGVDDFFSLLGTFTKYFTNLKKKGGGGERKKERKGKEKGKKIVNVVT